MLPSTDDDRAKILVVDDEPFVVDALAELCLQEFCVVTASNGQDALAELRAHPDVAVVLSDQRMPGMNGTDLLIEAATIRPEATRILLTGYSDLEAVVRAINEGGVYHYVTKPWQNDELLAVVRRAAERHHMMLENQRILALMADEEPRSQRARELTVSASEVERSLLARDNERLLQILEDFRDSFWHLRKLQEVLPICMGCGKVRDEKGKWMSLSSYLQQHAAFFSHGYCPPCETNALLELDKNEP